MYSTATLKQYADLYAQTVGVPPDLFSSVIQTESGWNPSAIGPMTSTGQALGIAQFMPGTAAQYGIDPMDPIQGLWGSSNLLADLYRKYGSWEQSLFAYGTTTGGSLTAAQQNLVAQARALDQAGVGLGGPVSFLDTVKGWLQNKNVLVPTTPEGQRQLQQEAANAGGGPSLLGSTWNRIELFFERGGVMVVGGLILFTGLAILAATSSKHG